MIVTVHQPEHLPWLGLLDKISKADVFAVLDTVQYEKNYFQNRNKIRSNSEKGFSWLTVPIRKQPLDTLIKDIEISYGNDWFTRYINIVRENYKHSNYFSYYYPIIQETINKKPKYLVELNMDLLTFFLKELGIGTKVIRATDLGAYKTRPGADGILLDICKTLGADQYLSGVSGQDYLNVELFHDAGMEVKFHEFEHPEYVQQYSPFISHMSSIDLLFNYGPDESTRIVFQ